MSRRARTHTLPDGRRLCAIYEGELVGWVVHLIGQEHQPVAARDIHDAFFDLLEPVDAVWPPWFKEAAQDLAARDTPRGRRYPCPCCDYWTLGAAPTGTHNICEVCFWEDDAVQFHNPDYEGGANDVSLHQARRNFRAHRVSEPRFKAQTRPPRPEEQP